MVLTQASIGQSPSAVEERQALLVSELERVRTTLAGIPSIRHVLVFGSVASGAVHEWSDLDLVVVQQTDARFLDRAQALMDLTRPQVGVQFLVYTPSEFEEMALRPFVQHEMLRKGKTLPMHPKTDAERWLAFATDDLRMARLAQGEAIWSQACFHAQQCVEKCLEALLARTGRLLPRTHVIGELWRAQETTTREAFAAVEGQLQRLDRFYIPTRYPDAVPGTLAEGLPKRGDADEALTVAEDCMTRSRAFIASHDE